MRVGIIALLHESNTFIAQPTTLQHFEESLLVTGQAVRQSLADTHHEVGGFFAELDAADATAVPIFAARTLPYGTITAEAFTDLMLRMFSALEVALPLDGLLVAPHGATVSESHPDADGYWLSELRKRLGPRLPIMGTVDPHGNLTPRMVQATQALVAYRSNPHLDQRARGQEAARLMLRTLRGEIQPVQAAAFPPLAINIEKQHTEEAPCRPWYELADRQLQRPGILSNSLFLGFPYADVVEMGAAVLAISDGSPALAASAAAELAEYLWSHRQEFAAELLSIPAAVQRARELPGPVCLLDMGDNVGGGSPADGTTLAHELRHQDVGPAFVCLCDAAAVLAAQAAGPGNSFELPLGGKSDTLHGEPLLGHWQVLSLHEGKFEEPQPRHGGYTRCDQGPTAIVHDGRGLTVMLTTRRMPPFSLRQLTAMGIEPAAFQVLVAKGANAPLAAYAPVCPHLLKVNTPGVTTADMHSLPYTRRRRPMFPFEPETTWDVQTVLPD